MAAQPTYSLAEIRAVERPAWKEDYLYACGKLLRIVVLAGKSGVNHTHIRPTSLRDGDDVIADGWMHLPDCDCPLCIARHQAASNGKGGVDPSRPIPTRGLTEGEQAGSAA